MCIISLICELGECVIMSIVHKVGRYALVGIVNTCIHWLVFGVLFWAFMFNQAVSNLVAFLVAVSCSFVLNGYFTFGSALGVKRYVLFTAFMGLLSYWVGWFADRVDLLPLFTLVIFTVISFVLGFLWSHFIVFKK